MASLVGKRARFHRATTFLLVWLSPPPIGGIAPCHLIWASGMIGVMSITVFLADDNLLVREGVRALMELAEDLEVVGVAGDFDGLVEGAESTGPQVLVTDIRMSQDFRREGIEAAKLVRERRSGAGVVVLSQYDDPEYAVTLLSDGAAGFAYLLKDRVAEGLSRFLPGGVAAELQREGRRLGGHRRVGGHGADVGHPRLLACRRENRSHRTRDPAQPSSSRDEKGDRETDSGLSSLRWLRWDTQSLRSVS